MEKSQYELCLEVLRRLDKAGVLKDVILIGSWCVPFYKQYFSGVEYPVALKTRDIDFLIPSPNMIRTKADIPELLKDLGFIVSFKGSKGYIKLEHPELVIEFLVPEKGRGTDKPVRLPTLGVNAQGLRFLNFLTDKTILVEAEGISLTLPHPANFALHKLIISQRRSIREKGIKDRDMALSTIRALIGKGEIAILKATFKSAPEKWQSKISGVLVQLEEKEILRKLKES